MSSFVLKLLFGFVPFCLGKNCSEEVGGYKKWTCETVGCFEIGARSGHQKSQIYWNESANG